MRNFILLLLAACARTPAPVEPVVETPPESPDPVVESAPEAPPALGERIVITTQDGDPTPEAYGLPATVILPEGEPGSAPCVVFIAGSGPTDRDWLSAGVPGTNGSARQLAEALYAEGIGSLRYDKAAIAENSTPVSDVQLDLYRDEVRLAWRHMTDQPVCGRVSTLGSSEGSVHAFRSSVLLQDEPRFGGVLSLSGPSKSMMLLIKDQLKDQLPEGTDLAAVDLQLDDLEERIRRLPEQEGPPLLSLVPNAAGIWMAVLNPDQGELVRDLFLTEPGDAHAAYAGPAMVLAASHDVQVPVSEAEEILAGLAPSEALRRYLVVENANHVYKQETRSRGEVEDMELVLAYFQEGVPLAEGVVSQIRDFLFALEGGTESP